MKNSVKIKSFKHGISLHLPQEETMENVLEMIAFKFKESASFFKDAKMILSIEGRELNDEEENAIVDVIESNSDIKILCLIGKDAETEAHILKALEQYQNVIESPQEQNLSQFYKGGLKNGQILETDSSIIVLGDVKKGSNIISKKDIIIIGGLYGNAYAGTDGEEGHYIIALDIAPECLKIGKLRYTGKKKAKWLTKPKYQPQMVHIVNDEIIVETISKEFTKNL